MSHGMSSIGADQRPCNKSRRLVRRSTGRTVEEFATAVSYEAACQWVDRHEVDVLQELASSGRYPVAPLARAVLDGAHDALGPLADALEEAGDPQAPQVRGWINR